MVCCNALFAKQADTPLVEIQLAFRAHAAKSGMPMAFSNEDTKRFLGDSWAGRSVYVHRVSANLYAVRPRKVVLMNCAQCARHVSVDVGHQEREDFVALCSERCTTKFSQRMLLEGWRDDPAPGPDMYPESCVEILFHDPGIIRYKACFTEIV